MIFSHWYFCHTLKMSPQDTCNYLEFLFQMEEGTTMAEKIEALKWLEKQDDSLLQAYAVPLLVKGVLVGGRQDESVPNGKEWEWQIYLSKSKNLLSRLLETRQQETHANQCLNLIEEMAELEYKDLVDKVLELPCVAADHEYEFSYLETDECVYPIVLLSVLCVIAREDSKMVAEVIAEKERRLINTALDLKKGFGLLTWKLAMEVQCYCGMTFDDAVKYFPEYWVDSAECLEIAALIMLEEYKLSEKKSSNIVGKLIEESFSLDFFTRHRNEMPEAVWMDEKADFPKCFKTCAVLWQNVLWNTAFEYDAKVCADRLRMYWNAPVYARNRNKPVLKKEWRNLLIPAGAWIPDSGEYQDYLISTPWQQRAAVNGHGQDDKNPFSEFRDMVHNASALRVFEAAILLRRMIGKGNTFPIEYCRVLLNMGDIFQSKGVLAELSGEPKYWGNAVLRLGYFAKKCVDMLGRGDLNSEVPRKILSTINEGRKKATKNQQLNLQYQVTGVQVCIHWAVESLRTGSIGQGNDIETPWFIGGAESCAVQLCRYFFGNGILQERHNYKEPLLLCIQAFPNEYRNFIAGSNTNSWVLKYKENKEKVTLCDVMLSKELFLAEWEDLGELRRERFEKDAWLPILTMRLHCLLLGGVQGHERWYNTWRDGIASFVSEQDVYGTLFYQMANLLTTGMAENDVPPYLVEIIKIVIGTVHSYTSEETIFYQYILTRKLAEAWKHWGNTTGADAIGQNIIELYSKRDSTKERLLLEYTLKKAQEEIPPEVLLQVKGYISDHWKRQCVTGNHHSLICLEKEEWNPLTDFALQKNHAQLNVMRHLQNIGRLHGKKTEDLFKNPAGAETDGWYVGIVTNERDTRHQAQEMDYAIYYGAGKGEIKSRALYRKGEVVGVMLNKMNIEKIGKLAWKSDGNPILVRLLELSAEKIQIRLPNGDWKHAVEQKNDKNFQELINLWEPDISRMLQRTDAQCSKQLELEREVYYDKALDFYIPAERDFSRLIVENFFSKDTQQMRLVFIRELVHDGQHSFLFSADLGVNYLLFEENWTTDSFHRLEEKLVEGKFQEGLIVTVCLTEESGRLALFGNMPFDEKNWGWKNCFSEEEYFVIHRESEETEKWYVDVNVSGMPDQVSVLLPPFTNMESQTECHVQLREDGWNVSCQRHAEVKVEKLQFKELESEWRTPEKFKLLYELKVGDILRLKNSWIRKQREGYHLLMTESNLAVFCAAESLSLEAEKLNQAMVTDRVCIVEQVSFREADIVPDCEAIELSELNGCKDQAEGLVANFTEELNTAGEEIKKISLEVWINLNEKIVPVTVPVTAFQMRPRSLGAPVLAVRQEDGKWLFQASLRKIQVRALWEVQDHKSDRNARITGVRLGRNLNIPGYGWRLVTQAKDSPILYLWDESAAQKETGNLVCGIEPGMGKVTKIKRRNFPWEAFPYAKHKDLVQLLATGGKELFGDSGWGEFDEKTSSAEWSVGAGVYLCKEHDGVRYYDLRRYFYARNMKTNSETDKQDKRLDEQYERWVDEGDYHVIGAKVGEHSFRLENLKVPRVIGQETLRDRWTDQVSFVEHDQSWVLGRYYPYSRMRALLIKKDDVWVASCHEAVPFRVDDELAREFNVVSGDTVQKKLYYAGMDEQDYLRFEWGHGFTLLVSVDDILDSDGNKIGYNLFYGDMIKYFTMLNDGGEHGWHIVVDYQAIVRQVEGRIWDDSIGGPIVQLLSIRRDLEKGEVFVERVSVSEKTVREEAGLFNGWGFYEVPSAELEKESIDTLLEEEGYKKDIKIIFAQLKPGIDPRRATRLTFVYIPLNGKRGDTWLLEGKTVCMVAGDIVPTGVGAWQNKKLSNDYRISLYLPRELPHEKDDPQMCVSVLRREFSVDESKLRTLYSDNAKKYYGCKMLVRLKSLNGIRHGTNEWAGNIISTPKRKRDSLIEWVRTQEYCLVALGLEKKQPLAEVAPGIISHISPNDIQESFSQGTLAALWLEEEKLKVKIVLPGDMKYLPESGRPAELLIMDGTAKSYVKLCQAKNEPKGLSAADWRKINEELERNHFTVAGLPQLLVTDRKLMEKKISEPIPRLAYLVRGQKGESEQDAEIHIKEDAVFHAVRLLVNQRKEPELRYFYPDDKIVETKWECISFMDGTVTELMCFINRGRWHYHDRNAAFYNCQTHQLDVIPLPDGKRYGEILLFPDKMGRLRYRETDFCKYGFSAREVIENGLPQQNGKYPIAGVTEDNIWIEIFPGKLLDIPMEYLFAGEKKLPLTRMWTKMLSPGDMVCLWQDEGFAGNQRKLILQYVIFGSRAGFGRRNTIFPIRERLEDGLCLGTDLWPVILPVRGEEWVGQKFACITGGNRVFPLSNAQKLQEGDVLLVDCARKLMTVNGWESVKIKPAKRECWKNAEWLLDDLLNKDKKRWMGESDLSLPMQVNNYRTENGELCAWVFYQQPDIESLTEGTILCCICVGLRQSKNDTGWVTEMVVRAGRALLKIPITRVVPGLDERKAGFVAKFLRRERWSFWIHKEKDGWHGGLCQVLRREQSEIQMLSYVEKAKGILCLSVDNLALKWLPEEKASRAGKRVDGNLLWQVLSERKKRLARYLENDVLSLTETWQNEQKYDVLKADGSRYRATPMEKVNTDQKGVHCYLAELYPLGDLISLYSELEYDCASREPIPIEIGLKQRECITAFSYGKRRKELHLTPWVYKALSRASDSDSSGRFEELSLSRFRQEIPDSFNKYRRLPKQVDNDGEKGLLDYELLQDSERTSEQLIYLNALISKKRGENLNFGEIYEFIRLTLKAWIEEQGKYIISGLDSKEKTRHTGQIDVAPAIAAILLMNSIKGQNKNDRLEKTAKPLSVHLTRMLGIICGSSIHQEILLKDWLVAGEKTSGLWRRLKYLPFRGETIVGETSAVFDGQLTPNQVTQILNICNSLRMHNFWDEELELVAESVLLSIGELDECDRFYRNMCKKRCITEKMSVLGRILTPSAGSDIAKDNLSENDIKFLKNLLLLLLREGSVPLSLVTITQIPISDSEKRKGIGLCDEFCRLVRAPRNRGGKGERDDE